MTMQDRHLNAFRDDLADIRLKGQVEATRFVEGRLARVAAVFADVKSQPRADASMDTQFLHGELLRVFDECEGWAWVQGVRDNYVGYVESAAIGEPDSEPTHHICVPRTFLYPEPDMKKPRCGYRSLGSLVCVTGEAETRGTRYAKLTNGEYVIANHVVPVGVVSTDFVTVAETLLHAPYLWGGATAFGIDCSGLVQLALRMTGVDVVRDTQMQQQALGSDIAREELRRGDLVFWKGHVAIMRDERTVIHANGASMMVSLEPLDAAIERIGFLYGQPVAFRRISAAQIG